MSPIGSYRCVFANVLGVCEVLWERATVSGFGKLEPRDSGYSGYAGIRNSRKLVPDDVYGRWVDLTCPFAHVKTVRFQHVRNWLLLGKLGLFASCVVLTTAYFTLNKVWLLVGTGEGEWRAVHLLQHCNFPVPPGCM